MLHHLATGFISNPAEASVDLYKNNVTHTESNAQTVNVPNVYGAFTSGYDSLISKSFTCH